MELSQIVLVCFSLLVCLFTCEGAVAQHQDKYEIIEKARQSNVHLIGQLGLKLFFRSNVTQSGSNPIPWYAGRSICSKAGVDFGTVDNQEELSYILNEASSLILSFWVDGTLNGQNGTNSWIEGKEFNWNDGTEVFTRVRHDPSVHLCLTINSGVFAITSELCSGESLVSSRPTELLCQFKLGAI